MVLDRILLWMFTIACVVGMNENFIVWTNSRLKCVTLKGTAGIIMAAPSHYDLRKPIDIQYSKLDKKNSMKFRLDNMEEK